MTDQELFDKYNRYAQKLAYRMRRSYRLSQEDEEDIASSAITFLLVQRSKINFNNHVGAVDLFCKRVVLNAARNALEQLRKHGVADSLDQSLVSDGEEGSSLHDLIADERVDTERALLAKESRRNVRRLVKKLKPDHQLVLTQRYGLDGRDPMLLAEIAAESGVTKAGVRNRLENALEQLRKKLRDKRVLGQKL